MSNTIIYEEDWVISAQKKLSEPNKWKEICNVEYTNSKVLNNPYITDPTVQSGTRGSAYTMQDVTLTNESVDITTFKILPQVIDRADLAQSSYVSQMDMAERQAVLLNEAIETALFADYANLTTFDNTELGGGAGNITVSVNNIDNIIGAIKRKIRVANGESKLDQNGGFVVWRPADMEILEEYCRSTGYSEADKALKNGISQGFFYMGLYHYSSNKLTAGHVVAGVRGIWHLGIVKSTYGQIVVTQDPLNISGIGVIMRVDFKMKAWTKTKPLLFNITVA